MKLHGGPNLARGPEFDTHALKELTCPYRLRLHGDFGTVLYGTVRRRDSLPVYTMS